ncbi:MAG: biotin-dependent carboxyltransferase family protein [Brevefilum sp.]|nr:biotin-dependent carboxyltransferase family protein [Brevefilum sp.]
MTLYIQEAALMMTVQDGGRFGYQRYGMPESGPMDGWAFQAANRLVGNDPGAACVEVGFSSAEISLERRCLLALCGAGYSLSVNGRPLPLWMSFLGKPGDHIRMDKIPGGNWAYLAAAGGIQSEVWMGSRSAYPAAGLGRKLAQGDRLPLGEPCAQTGRFSGRSFPTAALPPYSLEPVIRVIPGPHLAWFTSESWDSYCQGAYFVSTQSDRMGYRLTGPTLAHHTGADLVSQGMVQGEIQVPGDGQPIVMMPDHPTTGGYACIATVIKADLPRLAQVEPGRGSVRFKPVNLDAAHAAWVEVNEKITSAIPFEEDAWLGL